ncbi:unnamed protein product [Arctogadus glacialis]
MTSLSPCPSLTRSLSTLFSLAFSLHLYTLFSLPLSHTLSLSTSPPPSLSICPSISLHFSPSISLSTFLPPSLSPSLAPVLQLLYKLTELEFPKPLPAPASILQFNKEG